MAKPKATTIQTNLLGMWVIIGPETGTRTGPDPSSAGQGGQIVSVYLDPDGDPKYTILVPNTGKLIDLYSCSFRKDPQQPIG